MWNSNSVHFSHPLLIGNNYTEFFLEGGLPWFWLAPWAAVYGNAKRPLMKNLLLHIGSQSSLSANVQYTDNLQEEF